MSTTEYKGDVCSHKHSFFLDNFIRRLFQNPEKILKEYIQPHQTVIDLGCGPGFFTLAMARMVAPGGKVIAVDLQEQMLAKTHRKADKMGLTHRVQFHLCSQDEIGLAKEVKADFILAYYMVHETPDQNLFLSEVKSLLKPGGRCLIVEPRFHVSKKAFEQMTANASDLGFTIEDRPKKKGGLSLLLSA